MIRQNHQPSGPKDIVAVLATLSEPLLLSMIEEKSKAMDVAWLDVMLDQGLLEIEDITVWSQLPLTSMEDMTYAWGRRIEAFLGFLQAGSLVEQRQAFTGMPDVVHSLAVLPASDAFKAWFDKAAALVVAEHHDTIGRLKESRQLGTDAQAAMTQTLALWTMAACMLDRPQVVKNLVAIDPGVGETSLPVGVLGEQMTGLKGITIPLTQIGITPAFMAMQFSHTDCIDALLQSSGSGPEPLLGMYLTADLASLGNGTSPVGEATELFWSANLVAPRFLTVCDIATHAKMSRLALGDPGACENIKKAAARALASESMAGGLLDDPQPYIRAFQAAGVFDLAPLEFAQKACLAGYADVIQGLSGIDWSKLSDVTILNAARAHDAKHPHRGHQEAICALIDAAVMDGEGARAMAIAKSFYPKAVGPIDEIVRKGMQQVLRKYLDHGLPIDEPLVAGGPTLLEVAKKENEDMLGLIFSWRSRRAAHGLIEEIMRSSKTSARTP